MLDLVHLTGIPARRIRRRDVRSRGLPQRDQAGLFHRWLRVTFRGFEIDNLRIYELTLQSSVVQQSKLDIHLVLSPRKSTLYADSLKNEQHLLLRS